MTNEEFQKVVLHELKTLNNRFDNMENRFDNLEHKNDSLEGKVNDLVVSVKDLKEGQKRLETRQDEIYQVVRAIEHSNEVGRSELDSQNIRLAKMEGKLKKTAKVFNDDIEIENASSL